MSVWCIFVLLWPRWYWDVIPSPQWECPAPIYATTILGTDESQNVVWVHPLFPVYGYMTVDGYNSESFQSRASQGRSKTDVPSFKTKVLIFKRCPKISEKLWRAVLMFGSYRQPAKAGRQTGSSHENTISAFTVSLSPLSKANTHPSKLQTHFLQRQTHIALECKHKFSQKHTTSEYKNKHSSFKRHLTKKNVHKCLEIKSSSPTHLVPHVPPPWCLAPCLRIWEAVGVTYIPWLYILWVYILRLCMLSREKQCATNLQFLASHHPDHHA